MKRLLLAVAMLGVAFVAITVWALEAGGVAVVETRAPDGSTRATHLWFAAHDGELWLEAGSPENRWFADLRRDPRLSFRADDHAGEYRGTAFEDLTARTRIRALLREKYGWRDRWVGLFVPHSQSLAVRLDPAAP